MAGISPEEIQVTLPAQARTADTQAAVRAAARFPRPKLVADGQPAPGWQLASWSGGKIQSLDQPRGRIVVLFFWRINSAQSLIELPAIAQLRGEFEPRGVFFLAIHGPGEDETLIRSVLEFKRSPILWAIDRDLPSGLPRNLGATAWQYGLGRVPVAVIIDKEGKISFRTDDPKRNTAASPFERFKSEEEMLLSFRSSVAGELTKLLDRTK